MPIIDLNIKQMMCYRCTGFGCQRLVFNGDNFFTGKTLGPGTIIFLVFFFLVLF